MHEVTHFGEIVLLVSAALSVAAPPSVARWLLPGLLLVAGAGCSDDPAAPPDDGTIVEVGDPDGTGNSGSGGGGSSTGGMSGSSGAANGSA